MLIINFKAVGKFLLKLLLIIYHVARGILVVVGIMTGAAVIIFSPAYNIYNNLWIFLLIISLASLAITDWFMSVYIKPDIARQRKIFEELFKD